MKKEKNSKIEKGKLLEYRVKRLLFHLGYFSQANIVYYTSKGKNKETITDLDVVGYQFLSDFTCSTKWIDCKSGNTQIMQHINWINGIKSQINIDDIIFIKKGIRQEIREYAKDLGIKIFDLEYLDILEKNLHISQDDWSGSYDINTLSTIIEHFPSIEIDNKLTFKKIYNFMISEYWTYDLYSQIKKSITALRQLAIYATLELSDQDLLSIKWGIYNLILLFMLSVLRICGEIYYFSDIDKEQTIYNGLSNSFASRDKMEEINALCTKLVTVTIKSHNPKFNESQLPKLIINEPPTYFEDFCDLVKRACNNPVAWTKSITSVEYFLMEFDLKQSSNNNQYIEKIKINNSDFEVVFKSLIFFLISTTKIPRKLFSILDI